MSKPSSLPATEVITAPQTETRLGRRYKVLIHNDDTTPMDMVVAVLMRIFHKAAPEAAQIMLEAHNKGVALVVVLPFEEAEFRVDQAHSLARGKKYPLTFSIEPE